MKSNWKINMTRSINIRSGVHTQLHLCVFLLLMFMTSISIINGQETLTPLKTVTIFLPGGSPIYNCGSSFGTITSVQWLINGTLLKDLNLTNVETEFSEVFGQGSIIFRNISVEPHNNTIIQCRATFNNGETVESNNSTLLIQGLLPAVGSLTATSIPLDSIISLTWTPPFSLDIPNVDPDITYCVGVANSASSSSFVIHGITDIQYNYTVPHNNIMCDNYTFTITPVNMVGNGTSASMAQGELLSESMIQESEDFSIEPVQNGSEFLITFYVSAPVCSGSVSLQDIYDSSDMLGPIEVIPDNQNNSISVMIPLNRFFNATFTLKNSAGSATSNINISTHDVQDITYNIQDEPVNVTIDYIENTEALGALIALMYLDQDGNIVCDQSIYAAIRKGEDDFTLPMGDPAITNTYMGLAYDIERNGLEDKAYPAVRRDEDISKMPISSGSASNCIVTYVSGIASVSCVDSTSSGYQVILLQGGLYSLVVVNVMTGEQKNLPVIPSGRYCILERPMGNNFDSEVKYSREFIAEEDSSTIDVEIVNGVDVIGIAIGVVVLLLCTLLIVLILVVIVATIKIKKKTLKSAKCGSNNYEVSSQLELQSVSVHMEDRLPIYTDVIPAALRQVSVHTNSTNFSDEPLVEAPPPLPPCSLEPTEVPPPLPPPYSPPEKPENYSSVRVVKDDSTSQTTMGLRKDKAKDADLVYSDIHTGRGAEMSPPNVFGVKYEEVTGSKNKHGQNYPFVILPNQTQCYDGDETTVIYTELKTKEATQEVKTTQKDSENSEDMKKELATQSDEEMNEELATGSGEEMKEGIATGSGEEEDEGLATGSDEEKDERLTTESDNAVEQVTSDTDPDRHITAIIKSSTSFIDVKIFFHGYDTSDTYDSIQCTEPNDPACPIAGELYSYAMLKPSVSKIPTRAYMCPGFADDAFDASKYAKPSDSGPISAAGNEVERDVNKLDTLINKQCNKNEILNKLEIFINKQYNKNGINKTGWHSVQDDDPGSMHGEYIIEEQELSSISTGDKMKLHTTQIVPLWSDQLVLVDGVDDDMKCEDLYPDSRPTPRSGVTWLGQPFSWPLTSVMLRGIPGSLVNMLCKMIVTPKVKMKVEEYMKRGCYTSVIN